jgi:hypothetical protein
MAAIVSNPCPGIESKRARNTKDSGVGICLSFSAVSVEI